MQVKLLAYGKPFAGKSHLAYTFPKPYVISTDGNAQYYDVDYEIVSDIEEYAVALDKFINNPGDYETLVIDNIHQVYEMAREYELDKKGIMYEGDANDHGKTWKMVRVRFLHAIRPIGKLKKLNWVLIDHEEEYTVTDQLGRETTQYRPMVPDTKENIHGHLTKMSSLVGRVYRKDTKGGKQEHYISFGEHGNELAGVRLPVKKKLIENTYTAIVDNIDAKVNKIGQ